MERNQQAPATQHAQSAGGQRYANRGAGYNQPYHHQQQQQPHYYQHRASGPGGPMKDSPRVGLFGFNTYSQRRFSIPLKNVAIRARVVDFFARVEVTQEYVNQDRNPVEVTYTFPVAARSAVCGFSAEVDGRKIVAEVKENEEAADMYDDALSSGHGAYTGRSERPNVFTAVVGNLPPGKQATIHITYVTELGLERRSKADEAPQLRFILPARLAFKRKKNVQGHNTSFYDKRPDFKLSIDVDFALSSRITGVSASQPVSIKLPSPSQAHVKLGSMVNALKHDFTLLISLGDKLQQAESNAFSYGLLEASENNDEYAAALVLYPSELFPASAVSSKVTEEEESEDEATEEKIEEDEEKEGGDEEAAKEESAAPETKKAAPKKEKPSITDLRLDWGDLPAKEHIKNTAIPNSIFYSRGVLFLYSVLPKEAVPEGQDKIKVSLKGKLGDTEISHDINIDAKAVHKSSTLHQLYARAAIRALEKGVEGKTEEEVKKEVIDLSIKYTLSSRFTTFIAIEERDEATDGTMQRRVVPLNGLGYRQHGAAGRGRGRGRGGFTRGGASFARDDDRFRGGYSRSGDDRRGGDRGGGQAQTYGNRDGGAAGGESWGGRGEARSGGRDQSHHLHHRQRPAPVQQKKLEITEELTQQLVDLKGNDRDHWMLNSALAKLLDRNITQIVDALVGVPIVDYISNVWATALAATVLAHSPQKDKYAAVLEKAEAWLGEETKKYFLDDKDKWLAKAKAFLHL